MNLINEDIKNYVKKLMKKCDDDADLDFLYLLGKFRKEIVFEKKIITLDEFDALMEEIVEDSGDK